MNRDLPPFHAVRAFEAAARHMSFKRAAQELHVTQSAISHQVKALESFVGTRLFHRAPRGVSLTAAGETYLPVLGEALDSIAGVTDRLRSTDPSGPLMVRTTPAFAARWLIPRLDAFRGVYPDIDMRISTSIEAIDFAREGVDVVIRFGQDRGPGLRVDPFLGSTRFPVYGPKLLKGRPAIREVDDLRHYTLLHELYGEAAGWARWLELAGATRVDASRGPRLEHCELEICAAIEGQGVALAYGALVEAELRSGELIKPFNMDLPPEIYYSIVSPAAWADRPKIAAFRDWLLGQAARAAEAA
jgi:LysR family glycine cleavage system transcriptional activator